MNSLGVEKDEVVRKLLVENWFVVNEIEVVINELLLEGSVVPLDIGVNLGTPGIGKEVSKGKGVSPGIHEIPSNCFFNLTREISSFLF